MRLFTGLSLPLDLREELKIMQCGVEAARWTDIDNFHITLSFIGDVDKETGEEIDRVLSSFTCSKFELRLKGAGFFSHGHHRYHLWMGVEENEALQALKLKIDHVFEKNNLPFEHRKYIPHVTIARLSEAKEEQMAAFLEMHSLFKSHAFQVDFFTLFQSYSGKKGYIYDQMMHYPLS